MTETTANNFVKTMVLNNNSYSVRFYAQDLAGNVGQSNLITFIVDASGAGDTTAPFITVLSPVNGNLYRINSLVFNIEVNEEEIKLDYQSEYFSWFKKIPNEPLLLHSCFDIVKEYLKETYLIDIEK